MYKVIICVTIYIKPKSYLAPCPQIFTKIPKYTRQSPKANVTIVQSNGENIGPEPKITGHGGTKILINATNRT